MKIEAEKNSIGFKNPEENMSLRERISKSVNLRIFLLVLAAGAINAEINNVCYNEKPDTHNANGTPFSPDGKGMSVVIQPEN